MVKSHKEAYIPKLKNTEYNAFDSTNYIWQLDCNNFIAHRDKFKQGMKRLLLLLLV